MRYRQNISCIFLSQILHVPGTYTKKRKVCIFCMNHFPFLDFTFTDLLTADPWLNVVHIHHTSHTCAAV